MWFTILYSCEVDTRQFICLYRRKLFSHSVEQGKASRNRVFFHATFQLLAFSTLISKQLWMLYSSNFQTAFNLMYRDSLAFGFTSLTIVLVALDIYMSKLQRNFFHVSLKGVFDKVIIDFCVRAYTGRPWTTTIRSSGHCYVFI